MIAAATTTEWLATTAIGTGAFVPGALLILALDHDFALLLRTRAGVHAAALLLAVACHRGPADGRFPTLTSRKDGRS